MCQERKRELSTLITLSFSYHSFQIPNTDSFLESNHFLFLSSWRLDSYRDCEIAITQKLQSLVTKKKPKVKIK